MRGPKGVPGASRRAGAFSACPARAVVLSLSLALAFVPTSRAAAQEPSGLAGDAAPRVLSLDQALALASGQNPEVRRAVNSAQLNGSEMRSTWMDQLLPQVSLTLFQTAFTGNLQRQAFDNFGNPIADPQADWNYFSQTRHQLSLSWQFQGMSLFHAHRRQQLVNEDRDVAELVALTDVQITVQRGYLDALEQKELLAAEEELLEARRIDLDVAERLFSLGLRTRVDVLNAELAIEQQALALQQQETAHTRALLTLRTSMGATDTRPIEVVETEFPIFDPSGLDAGALISRAGEVSPTLRRSEVAIRSAQLGLSERRAQWWPRVAAGVSLYRQSFSERTSALFDPSITGEPEGQFYIQFSIPVLGGLSGQTVQQQQAAIELRNQRESDRQARLELEEAIRGGLLDLENQWATFRLAERSSTIAQEALRLAREEYRLGSRSFEDLRSAFEQEASTRRQVITARYAFYDAFLALEQAVGGPLRELIPAG